jgi:hypothetical protein
MGLGELEGRTAMTELDGRASRLAATQPLILLGMHRSGTSLTVRLLVDLGFHMGSWLSRDAEAVHFQRVNRRIYKAAGSDWGQVAALTAAMDTEAFVAAQATAVQRLLLREPVLPGQRAPIVRFFGPSLWSRLEAGQSFAWGWKDPRTALTFPIWAQIFPNARWVHVVRNGIDVSISTHRRTLRQHQSWRRFLGPDYVAATLDFEYCFQLWETYVRFIRRQREIVPPERWLEVRYEDLLTQPEVALGRLLQFAGQAVDADRVRAACARIDAGRLDNAAYALAYRTQIPALVASPLMQELGYGYRLPE